GALADMEIPLEFKELSSDGSAAGERYQLAILVPAKDQYEDALSFIRETADLGKKAIVIFPADVDLATVVNFLDNPNVDQILVQKYEWLKDLRTVISVLSVGNIFGMEKYLAEGDQVSYLRFKDFQGRQYVLSKVDEVAKVMGIRRMRRQHAVQAAEELVMNALYNAPRDETGEILFGNIDPHKRVSMDSPKPVSLRYSTTEQGLFMAVRDRFGALNKGTVLAYLKKCIYSNEQIDRKTIGAGLGIYLTVNRVQSYVVNVAPDVATEVIINIRQTRDFGVPGLIAFFEY
ncbi:hypothetical protein KKF84_06290, partial [Myxococcota bacterium]|nr:hypothetical protein [Myxococcota bacterium]